MTEKEALTILVLFVGLHILFFIITVIIDFIKKIFEKPPTPDELELADYRTLSKLSRRFL